MGRNRINELVTSVKVNYLGAEAKKTANKLSLF